MPIHSPCRGLVALGLLLTLLVGTACTPGAGGPGPAGSSVNVVQVAGLTQTMQLEIVETPPSGQSSAGRQRSITDAAAIQQAVKSLDRALPLRPRSRCLGQYRLRFHLSTSQVQEFEYFCQGGGTFLRGDQPFWSGQEVEPPAEFNQLMQRLLTATP